MCDFILRYTMPVYPGASSETDKHVRQRAHRSRHIPRDVKRAVWQRDGGQCAFVSPGGQRCAERTFLEYHHVQTYADGGPATVANISLRCWRHNQYEAELIFGPYDASLARESTGASPQDDFRPAAPHGSPATQP